MGSFKKAKLIHTLPPTPCTPEMRDQMVQAAKNQGRSLADIQREAFSIFLRKNFSKAKVEMS
jgi:hypothetical protein